VDALAVALLVEIWRDEAPLPTLQVSAITTEDPDALRSFLEGESHYRRMELEDAAQSFARAVALDSTFALVYSRLGSVYAWDQLPDHVERRREALYAAGRFQDRLPHRARALVEAQLLMYRGAMEEARAGFEEYLRRYPDDVEVWFGVGDARYHSFEALDLGVEWVMEPFDRILELDPALTPAFVHPMWMIPNRLDSAALGRYGRELGRVGSAFEAPFRNAVLALWGSDVDVGQLLESSPTANWFWVFPVAFRSGRYTPEEILGELDSTAASHEPSDLRQVGLTAQRAYILTATGRITEARQLIDSLPPGLAASSSGSAVLAGFARPDFLGGSFGAETDAFVHGLAALSTGDAERADLIFSGIPVADREAAAFEGYTIAAAGWSQIIRGDTASGIVAMERGLRSFSPTPLVPGLRASALLFHWLDAMASQPETRQRALQYLDRINWMNAPAFETRAHLVRARALEAAGEVDSARREYRRFLDLLEKADENLPSRSLMDQAVEALVRLGS
jgi:tetratricopeptide (TPR) repeat protein